MIKNSVVDDSKKRFKIEASKIMRVITKNYKTLVATRDGELKDEFGYRMKLARGELYEEFQDEKLEWVCWRNKRLEALAEDNHRALMHLQASLEAEWVEELTALELWYETENQNPPVVEVFGEHALTSSFEVEDYTAQVRVLDDRLSKVATELPVYEKRLRHVLGGYIGLVGGGLRTYPDLQRTAQLQQATALMAQLKKKPGHADGNSQACRPRASKPSTKQNDKLRRGPEQR